MYEMGKKKKKSSDQPSANSQSYSGPIIPRAMKEEEELYTVPLKFTGVVSSTAGGVIDSYYSSDPSSYALSEWTALAGLYGEYRILGMEMKFAPYNRYSKTTVVCTPLLVLVDRENPTSTLGSYQTAMSHESCRIVTLEDPWTEKARMQNAEESQFIATSSAKALWSIKFYADGLSVSTAYGRSFVFLLIQFRGRR